MGRELAWVAGGGAAGAVARYLVGRWVAAAGAPLPYATLIVNVTGSFVLGFVALLVAVRADVPSALVPLVAVGFCGAYTTFSTFAVDTLRLSPGLAALNVVGNNVLAVGAAAAGMALARWLAGPPP